MNHIKILLYVPLLMPFFNFAIQEPPMVHIQKAQDAAQFAGQVVAFTPVSFIDDTCTYKASHSDSGMLHPALRYGYVSGGTIHDWRFTGPQVARGHILSLLLTVDVNYGCHVLLTRLLAGHVLRIRKITSQEAMQLWRIVGEKRAHFEDDNAEITNALKKLQQNHKTSQLPVIV